MLFVCVLTESRDAHIVCTGKGSGENEMECMGKQDPIVDIVAQFRARTGMREKGLYFIRLETGNQCRDYRTGVIYNYAFEYSF